MPPYSSSYVSSLALLIFLFSVHVSFTSSYTHRSFSAEQLNAPAVWGDPTGAGRTRLEAEAAAMRAGAFSTVNWSGAISSSSSHSTGIDTAAPARARGSRLYTARNNRPGGGESAGRVDDVEPAGRRDAALGLASLGPDHAAEAAEHLTALATDQRRSTYDRAAVAHALGELGPQHRSAAATLLVATLEQPGIDLISLGGTYHRDYDAFFGLLATVTVSRLQSDVLFMSTTAAW